MHAKAATFALFILATTSYAAPVLNRRSLSNLNERDITTKHEPNLRGEPKPRCSDEATTYGPESGTTESSCAAIEGVTGFREASDKDCRLPVRGNEIKGFCFVETTVTRRSPEEDATPPADNDPPETPDATDPSAQQVIGASSKTDTAPPVSSEKTSEPPCDPSDEAQQPLPSQVPPPQGPVKPPSATSTASSSSATQSITDVPNNSTANPHPAPPPWAVLSGGPKNDGFAGLSWLGRSLFKMFGGIF